MPPTLLLIGLVVGANNLGAAIALGALGVQRRRRIVLVFGLFEFAVPLLGLWLGREAAERLARSAEWLGPALLVGLGAWTAWRSQRERRDNEAAARRASSWPGLLVLAASLSLDNLIVGFALGLRPFSPLLLASTIALFSIVFTWGGLLLGERGRHRWGRPAELGAGVLLALVGVATWLGWL